MGSPLFDQEERYQEAAGKIHVEEIVPTVVDRCVYPAKRRQNHIVLFGCHRIRQAENEKINSRRYIDKRIYPAPYRNTLFPDQQQGKMNDYTKQKTPAGGRDAVAYQAFCKRRRFDGDRKTKGPQRYTAAQERKRNINARSWILHKRVNAKKSADSAYKNEYDWHWFNH